MYVRAASRSRPGPTAPRVSGSPGITWQPPQPYRQPEAPVPRRGGARSRRTAVAHRGPRPGATSRGPRHRRAREDAGAHRDRGQPPVGAGHRREAAVEQVRVARQQRDERGRERRDEGHRAPPSVRHRARDREGQLIGPWPKAILVERRLLGRRRPEPRHQRERADRDADREQRHLIGERRGEEEHEADGEQRGADDERGEREDEHDRGDQHRPREERPRT